MQSVFKVIMPVSSSFEGIDMAGKKTSVSKIKEIHRLIELNLSDRAIARALTVSRNTVALARMPANSG